MGTILKPNFRPSTGYIFGRSLEACCSRGGLLMGAVGGPGPFQTAPFSSKKQFEKKPPAPKRPKDKSKFPEFNVWQGITFGQLAKLTNKTPKLIFSGLQNSDFQQFYRGHADESIELPEHLARIATMFDFKIRLVSKPKKNADDQMLKELEKEQKCDVVRQAPAHPSLCTPRPPIVAIMGHVDHGKTTLLDFLRKSQIVKSEFGGITQHIGAFVVRLPGSDDVITFLDTPGHAAFKSMRARGAMVTDLVILVVAADDGVMDQTIESIKFARQANVPIIVAINKCDKNGVDIDRIKHQLLAEHIVLEEYGGDVQAVKISALKGTGIDNLKDAIITQSELMQLKADAKGTVEGSVIEARTMHGKGKTATVLVQRGTLTKGRFLVAGDAYCCVRAMYDEFGRQLTAAPPSSPVEVTGWRDDELPSAGDEVLEVENEKRAKTVVAYRKSRDMEKQAEEDMVEISDSRAKDRELYSTIRLGNIEAEIKNLRIRKKKKKLPTKSFRDEVFKAGKGDGDELPVFNVVLKGDVDGSVEAILEVCASYNCTHKCEFNVIQVGVGPVTKNDVELAKTFNATIYTFNVPTPFDTLALLSDADVPLKPFNVIYSLVSDFQDELSKKLPLVDKVEILGEGLVLQEFRVSGTKGGYSSKKIPVAGCRCTKGSLVRKNRVKILRQEEVIYDGEIESMKKGVEQISASQLEDEVGILVTDPPADLKFQPGDQVICYKISKINQVIDWQPPGF